MVSKLELNKGSGLEELLRAYFLRAGFFVIRGVPFCFADQDLTDVDLWLYERPTGTSRRVQICDIKNKQTPKAVERIFWTKGLAEALGVDGAYVATTDKRKSLRVFAEKLNLHLMDGTDIQIIQGNKSILYPDRLSEEEFGETLQLVDRDSKNKNLQDARFEIKSSLSEGFGAPSAVRALGVFCRLAAAVTVYHPNSNSARAAGRLVYLAAAITCESLDFVSVGAAFRTFDERRELILNAVRHGALSDEQGQQSLKLALALVEKYAPGGRITATAVENNLTEALAQIPAEIVADHAIKLLKSDQLFSVGRELEMACYQRELLPFDMLSSSSKSTIGALLDYAGVDRERFANSWKFVRDTSGPEIFGGDYLASQQNALLFDRK